LFLTQQEDTQMRDPHVHPQRFIWNPPENKRSLKDYIEYSGIQKLMIKQRLHCLFILLVTCMINYTYILNAI